MADCQPPGFFGTCWLGLKCLQRSLGGNHTEVAQGWGRWGPALRSHLLGSNSVGLIAMTRRANTGLPLLVWALRGQRPGSWIIGPGLPPGGLPQVPQSLRTEAAHSWASGPMGSVWTLQVCKTFFSEVVASLQKSGDATSKLQLRLQVT